MSCDKGRSQEDVCDLRKNMNIKYNSSQVPKEEQSNSNSYQIKVESRKRPCEITNTQNQRPPSPKKYQQDQTTSLNKTITITLYVNHKKNEKMKYELTHRKTGRLYAALNTLNAVKEEIKNHQGKEILARGIEGIEGYINLSMPLSCFPDGSHVEITFCKTESKQREDNPLFDWQDQVSANCVKFYISPVGKRKEKILKCREVHEDGKKLCVYGFRGDTIKDTLRKDGRFLSFVENDRWKLITNLDTIIENTQPIDELEGKLFEVEVEMKKTLRAAKLNKNSKKSTFRELKEHIMEEYPTLRRERERLRAYIKEETEKRRKKTLFNFHQANFKKLTKNTTPTKVLKLLSQFSDSVGLLVWNNSGNEGFANCFVFTGWYIFTCRHVINDIVGKDIERNKWADVISQCVKVTFDCEEFPGKEDSCFSVEPWFEISDVILDYAVLKLKENEQQVPAGLYNGIAPVPSNGLMYMIGHPDTKQKCNDGCALAPQVKQGKKHQEPVQGEEPAGDSDSTQFIYMYTQRSFQKLIHDPCRNAFYCGSSGSPVFDSKGSLVAMHTAGFICDYESGVSSIIEFGPAMEAILTDIKQKHKKWYEEECVNRQDVEMLSLDY